MDNNITIRVMTDEDWQGDMDTNRGNELFEAEPIAEVHPFSFLPN